VSYLERYTLLGALGIVTAGDDIDGGAPVETVTAEQAQELRDICAQTNTVLDKLCAAYGCTDIADFPASGYQEALGVLTRRQAKQLRDAQPERLPL
jgi:hypothetical protein